MCRVEPLQREKGRELIFFSEFPIRNISPFGDMGEWLEVSERSVKGISLKTDNN